MANAVTQEKRIEALERRLESLERELDPIWLRIGSELASFIETVDVFPAIPGASRPPRLIHYVDDIDNPDAEDQLWYAAPGYTVWQPLVLFTQTVGTPGT